MRERSETEDRLVELRTSIHLTPIATIVTDNRLHDNPIVEVNKAFEVLTGYRRAEIVGQNCRFLSGAGTDPKARALLRTAIARGQPTIVELLNYRKDGTPFLNAVMLAPMLDELGRIAMFVGSQVKVDRDGSARGVRQSQAIQAVGRLTPRARQILELMASGYRNKQIGGLLGITEKTVKMHRSRLLRVLNVTSSAEAIRIAVEAGMPSSRDEATPQ